MKSNQIPTNGNATAPIRSSSTNGHIAVLPEIMSPDTLHGRGKPITEKEVTKKTRRKHGKAARERDGIKIGIRNGRIYYNEVDLETLREAAKEIVERIVPSSSNLQKNYLNTHLLAQLSCAINELPDDIISRRIIYKFHILADNIDYNLDRGLCNNRNVFSVQLITALRKQNSSKIDIVSMIQSIDSYLQQLKRESVIRVEKYKVVHNDVRQIHSLM